MKKQLKAKTFTDVFAIFALETDGKYLHVQIIDLKSLFSFWVQYNDQIHSIPMDKYDVKLGMEIS